MVKNHKNLLSILALTVASISWGINAPMIKLGLQYTPVAIFMSAKYIIACLVLLPFAIRTWKRLDRKEFGLLALGSFISVTFGSVALSVGLQNAPSINSAVISLLGPLILYVLSVEFLKERMKLKTIVGLMVAFWGAVVIIGKPWEVTAGQDAVLFGNILFFISVLCSVLGTLMAKPVLKKAGAYQATFIHLGVGIVPIIAYASTQLSDWSIKSTPKEGLLALVYSAIAITLANFLFMYGLKYKEAQSTGIFSYVKLVTVVIAAWVILGEQPSPKFVLGAGLVLLGVYLAEAKLPRHTFLHHHSRH